MENDIFSTKTRLFVELPEFAREASEAAEAQNENTPIIRAPNEVCSSQMEDAYMEP